MWLWGHNLPIRPCKKDHRWWSWCMGWCGPPHTHSFICLYQLRTEAKFVSFKLIRYRIIQFIIVGKRLFQHIFALSLNGKLLVEQSANGSGPDLRGNGRNGRPRAFTKQKYYPQILLKYLRLQKSRKFSVLIIIRNRNNKKVIVII
jgi:hypothetical protein